MAVSGEPLPVARHGRPGHPDRHRYGRLGWPHPAGLGRGGGAGPVAAPVVGGARPLEAPWAAAGASAAGSGTRMLAVGVAPSGAGVPPVSAASLVVLALLGVVGARLGGAPPWRAAVRVVVGSGLAMALAAA